MFDENLKQIIMHNWHIVVARLLGSESRPLVNAVYETSTFPRASFLGFLVPPKLKSRLREGRRLRMQKSKRKKNKLN